MKTEEDEAFDDLAKRQGAWGGGFKAKQAMAADKLQEPERAALELCDYLECNDASMEAQCEAAAFIRKALAQPVQEPVAWTLLLTGEHHGIIGEAGEKFIGAPECYQRVNVYTTPPKREWVGLTDEETAVVLTGDASLALNLEDLSPSWIELVKAVEAKLKEKNNGT